jgi:hypothetical protein
MAAGKPWCPIHDNSAGTPERPEKWPLCATHGCLNYVEREEDIHCTQHRERTDRGDAPRERRSGTERRNKAVLFFRGGVEWVANTRATDRRRTPKDVREADVGEGLRCPRAKSDMSPCYLRDGEVTVIEVHGQRACVGCETLIRKIMPRPEPAAEPREDSDEPWYPGFSVVAEAARNSSLYNMTVESALNDVRARLRSRGATTEAGETDG